MSNTGLTDTDLNMIVSTVSACAEVAQLVLFGSRAKGTFKRGSDVDLAVKCEHLTYDQLAQMELELNENLPLPYKFDVVDYRTLDNPDLKSHIDRVGVTLFHREA